MPPTEIHSISRDPTTGGDDLLTISEVAARLRTPIATLRYWRHIVHGPVGFRVGKRVVYRRTDVEEWLEAERLRQYRSPDDFGGDAA